ncbi:hypothetical protein QAD02_017279, partial [Eretmocerus hayati]
ALELSPKDGDALMARSKCFLLLGHPDNALRDAESALSIKSTALHRAKALFTKAEALYYLGDFEMSLVHYFRGMRIRPDFDQFRLGAQKAQEAIQKILGHERLPKAEEVDLPPEATIIEFEKPTGPSIEMTNTPIKYLERATREHTIINPSVAAQNNRRFKSKSYDTDTILHKQLEDDRRYLMSVSKLPGNHTE